MVKTLNRLHLPLLSKEVAVPAYNRSAITTGIVHIGVGGFHRAHEAYYTDQVLHQGEDTWGICGVGLLDADRRMFEVLRKQDGLYTLLVKQSDGALTARVIGSIIECIFAPDDPEAVVAKLADPGTRIISLTITEGGYNLDTATGEFQIGEPAIQRDLNHPDNPGTVFGYITQALKRRRNKGAPGLTIQSCDNIQKNGDVMEKMLLAYVKAAEPGLEDWIRQYVTFPNSMVDRITPVTTPADIQKIRTVYGIEDEWPVVCEPFHQWIIENRYAYGRPRWESAGVQFVGEVGPYEKMKIRLLNAGHSLLGFLGTLYGCTTIDEAVRVPMLANLLREFMDAEVTPLLGKIEGINLQDYKDSLFQRFSNPYIRDQLYRICLESSAKIPKFLLPTLQEQLEKGGPIMRSALVVAAWCRYLELAGTPGYPYDIQDNMKDLLYTSALESGRGDPLAFLKIETVFHELAHNERFVNTYLRILDQLRKSGLEKTIQDLGQIIH